MPWWAFFRPFFPAFSRKAMNMHWFYTIIAKTYNYILLLYDMRLQFDIAFRAVLQSELKIEQQP